ncbi:SHOCT domain-containing protein [Phenylobacterium sp.]|uniref:SHOCT domain-containing protein n=1 Tax=Phenylobacterium sp. TaxID=1871053 RepID=UPI0027316E04|nr:SHOCT domain-containing protein [Phenylobacterium sp.]MDP1600934.1 SHOCT domain-containing protein [Phenylobacterium sp.]MDP3594050.1 SHOCT domain-containing protein [Phenylobacterium sp.]
MVGSRRGRPSLLGRTAQTAARTAVIAGTATAVSGKVAARQAAGAAPAPAAAEPAPPPAAAAPAAAPGGLTDEAIGKLQKLADLRASGVLTEEEFAVQKARILG